MDGIWRREREKRTLSAEVTAELVWVAEGIIKYSVALGCGELPVCLDTDHVGSCGFQDNLRSGHR